MREKALSGVSAGVAVAIGVYVLGVVFGWCGVAVLIALTYPG